MALEEGKTTLISCMSEVPDPRHQYNLRHKFIDIVVIVITAILCGMEGWCEIEDWAKAERNWLGSFLELPNGIPSHDTMNRVFQMIDPLAFHKAFITWVDGVWGKISGVVAIDGKTIRRSKEVVSGLLPAHVVSAWATEVSLVLGQLKTSEKSNEITAIPELLDLLDISGCIVTIDAMGTQKEIAKKIKEKKAEYILQVKGNQDKLQSDTALYFEEEVLKQDKGELKKEDRYWKDVCNEHGRFEKREYYVENNVSWLAERNPGWESLSGIGCCVSTVEKNGTTTVTTSYYIFSCEMSAEKFGKSRRRHWGIENGLHWVLDCAFREDDCRARAGNVAENMNVVRHITMNLLKQEKTYKHGINAKRKKCSYDQNYRKKVLGL